MTEHVHNRGEAQVLHPALTPFCQSEAQVLQGGKKKKKKVKETDCLNLSCLLFLATPISVNTCVTLPSINFSHCC